MGKDFTILSASLLFLSIFAPVELLASPNSSILVSGYASATDPKVSVFFSEVDGSPSNEVFSPGTDVRIVSFKSNGAIFEERKIGFSEFDGSALCSREKGGREKCVHDSLSRKLVVYMKKTSEVSLIKFFYKEKEISKAAVPAGLLRYKNNRIGFD